MQTTKIKFTIDFLKMSLAFFILDDLHFEVERRDTTLHVKFNSFEDTSFWCLFKYIAPNARVATPDNTPKRWMVESNKSSCHFLFDIQLLYRILENVTDVYNGTHFDGAIQNKKLSNYNGK